ncbi:hypothetical protein [Aquimarina longa]|uniref:hypothetical protein n=1 Tax=Aquimarina longa TaxID=1080221 RepID=UPI000783B17A|nr:hypothetical protein [Aquimarina longa]
MFDKNRNIKVGRDININSNNHLEQLNRSGLLEKKNECSIILEKEASAKWKTAFKYLFFSLVLFIILYFSLPILFGFLAEQNKDSILKGVFDKPIPQNIQFIITTVLAIVPIFTPLTGLLDDNDTQKKQREILKKINILLKEKEYLNKD